MGWKKPQTTLQSNEVSARPMGTPELPELKFPTRDLLSGRSGLGLLPAPHCALSLSGSSQWEVLPDMHAAVSPKVWQSEAVSQLYSLQQVPWNGEVKGHGHQSTLMGDLTFQDPQQNFSEVIGILPAALHSQCQPCSCYLFHS